jgi:hypothetical protein
MTSLDTILKRQQIERDLVNLGGERAQIEENLQLNRNHVKKLLVEAVEAGIPKTEIAALSGYSVQSIHNWCRELKLT